MERDDAEAVAVSEGLLDQTGRALMSGNFEMFAPCFALPTTFETFEGQVQVNTSEDLKVRFDRVVAFFRSVNTTDLVRHVLAASWFDDNTIHATHQTRTLSGLTLVQTPSTAFSVLKREQAQWKVTYSQYAISDQHHNEALTGSTK